MNTPTDNTKWLTPQFFLLFAIGFLVSFVQFFSSTLIPLYADSLGATAAIAGIAGSIFSVSALLARPVGGPAIDSFSRGKMLTLLMAIMTLAAVGHSVFRSIEALLFCRFIYGFGTGMVYPLCYVMVSDTLPQERMASGIGIFTMALAIGQALGPTLAIDLSDRMGYTAAFIFMGMAMFLGLLLSLGCKTPAPGKKGAFKIAWNTIVEPKLIPISLVLMVFYAARNCIIFFLALYGKELGIDNVSLYFLVNAAVLLVSRPLSGRLADKYGPGKVIVPGVLAYVLAFVLLGSSHSLGRMILVSIAEAIGFGFCTPTLQSLSLTAVPNERRGASSNTNFLFIDIGVFLGPSVCGALATAVGRKAGMASGYALMYYALIIPILLALVLFLFIQKRMPIDSGQEHK